VARIGNSSRRRVRARRRGRRPRPTPARWSPGRAGAGRLRRRLAP